MANNNESGNQQNFDQDNQQQSQSSDMNQDLDINNRSQERVGGAPNATGAGETSRSISSDDDLGTEDMNSDVSGTENFSSDNVNSGTSKDTQMDDVNDRSGNI